jgi:hypothetical protein
MSHIKNMQAFGKLTGICTGLGGTYSPGKQNLQVNAMTTLLNIAQQAFDEVKEAQAAYNLATNQRELGFQKIQKLSMGMFGILKASGTNPLLLADALNAKRRIWGARITKEPATVEPTETAVKVSSRPSYSTSYVIVADYFDQLVKTVAAAPEYKPNEPEFTLANLEQARNELFNLNKAVMEAEIRLEEARIKRNKVCYVGSESLVETANAIKTYVRSAFGFQSLQHQQVQKLRFTKPNL